MPRAVITGITGQDGSYLAELLIEKGYEVHGLVRHKLPAERGRLQGLCLDPAVYNRRLFLHEATIDDSNALRRILTDVAADEIYHLAAQSHVGLSFEMVESTCEVTAIGTLKLLEALRHIPKSGKLFHASSSEVFGRPDVMPQTEETPFRPVTPYGCAKCFATQMVSVYRRRFGLFACNGILYNHESPRRGDNFVTQKICLAAAAIKQGRQRELCLGNLDSQRDWGDARDYVHGMWMVLQNSIPEDFLFATGELHTVRDVVEIAFGTLGLDWRKYVKHDEKLVRPEEAARMIGNAAKAREKLSWRPTTSFHELISAMARAALAVESPRG